MTWSCGTEADAAARHGYDRCAPASLERFSALRGATVLAAHGDREGSLPALPASLQAISSPASRS